jgi:acyl-CoA reductase-like NAD-dependent aldehyde dehydrogenase
METTIKAVDPRTGEEGAVFPEATPADVDAAVRAAAAAAHDPALADRGRRAAALRGAADRLRAREDELVELVGAETGLPEARVRGELARTCGQLAAFAALVEKGEYVEAILDAPDPDAQPVPRPDIRRMLVPIGPVAVFGASNFPLAFSTAGGDTAAALAAGCPVVVKGHPSHPGTGTLVAGELAAAVTDAGLPAGTFAHVLGAANAIGEALVDHPALRAVAFTGSLRGGRALMDRAAARPAPIPVYAEMGSLNPVVLTSGAVAARGEAIAAALTRSVSDFGGQLCTKPGLVLVPDDDAGAAFTTTLVGELDARAPEVLLNAGIAAGLRTGLGALDGAPGVERLTSDEPAADGGGFRVRPSAYRAPAAALGDVAALAEEHFGPAVVVLTYTSLDEAADALERAGGQLTATVHAEPAEHAELHPLVAAAARVAGRVVFDGVPTGVAVTYGMQHGGPYPASSAEGTTSVGMTALRRFLRPVAYQDAPQELLPEALRDGNPLGIPRRQDGDIIM